MAATGSGNVSTTTTIANTASSDSNEECNIQWKPYIIDSSFMRWFRTLNQFNNSSDEAARYKLPEDITTIPCEVLTELTSKTKPSYIKYPPGNPLR